MTKLEEGNYRKIFFIAMLIFLISCEEEDPFVARTVSPVLIVFDDVPGYLGGGGLTAIPSDSRKITTQNFQDPISLVVSFYELDKSGILDHTIGIDSIPVSNLPITFSKRDGSVATDAITDTNGKIVITTTWEALGIADVESIVMATEGKTITIPLAWKGVYKGQSFTRFSQLVFIKESE